MEHNDSEILLVGFGDLSALVADFKKTFPKKRVTFSKTVAQGLSLIESDRVLIQPIYLLPGFEYHRLCREAAESGKKVTVGNPLLYCKEEVKKLAAFLTVEYGDRPVLFAGHGSHHELGQKTYKDLQEFLEISSSNGAFLAVLEGSPRLDSVMDQLMESGISELSLVPMTLTAGKHVLKDIFGDTPESFMSRLQGKGITPFPVYQPLLDFEPVRRMFIESCAKVFEAKE